jgi:hypothetical protein
MEPGSQINGSLVYQGGEAVAALTHQKNAEQGMVAASADEPRLKTS